MFQKDLFQGKTIFITGGSSGLGKSMALYLGQLGGNIVIGSRNETKVQETCEQLQKDHRIKIQGKVLNVRDPEQVQKIAGEVEQEMGAVDILINNAAGNFLCTSEDLSANAFRSVVETVLFGTFHCTQAFGKQMISKGRGNILNTLATYAWTGSGFVLPSACAKAGVLALTRSLAVEWAEYGIRVNAIAPGAFPTEGAWQRLIPPGFDIDKIMKKRIADGRFGNHEEFVRLAAFILADESAHITGETITIDGGEWIKGGGEFNFLADFDRGQLKNIFQTLKPSGKPKG
jgi:NAD(P)-dependent dehydrogenase (short-subunit alcohol dehydrogenase family)